jgi:hypothetical protein
MQVTQEQLHQLALKLIEVFSRQGLRRYGFERYWPLAGPVETFSEHATGQLEQGMAKALQNALESLLRQTAPKSFHQDAMSVASHLNAEPFEPRRPKKHSAIRRRSRYGHR